MLSRLAEVLRVDLNALFSAAAETKVPPHILLVDEDASSLEHSLAMLEKALPDMALHGFLDADEALAFARENRVQLAFLEIPLGHLSGLELCRELLRIEPRTNVVFLTASRDYALPAWGTGACGYLLKPLTPQAVRRQLSLLRHPLERNRVNPEDSVSGSASVR